MDPRLNTLAADLRRIFGASLHSLVAYGAPAGDTGDEQDDGLHTVALVEHVGFDDLARCAPLVPGWRRSGLAVPLVLAREEFRRTLDVFPLEYGDIIARHQVVFGDDPFAGMQVNEGDLRRACELQAKSHLIHLREGYLESSGDGRALGTLMARSAPALRSLLGSIERLEPGTAAAAGMDDGLVGEIARAADARIADPSALFTRYLEAVERLWQMVDRWRP